MRKGVTTQRVFHPFCHCSATGVSWSIADEYDLSCPAVHLETRDEQTECAWRAFAHTNQRWVTRVAERTVALGSELVLVARQLGCSIWLRWFTRLTSISRGGKGFACTQLILYPKWWTSCFSCGRVLAWNSHLWSECWLRRHARGLHLPL